jgi:hypothetical protein
MNLEYLYPIWVLLCLAAGALIGSQTDQGVFRGMTNGIYVAFLPVFLLMLGLWLTSWWRPILPPCLCGKCKQKQYRLARPISESPAKVRFKCPECGRVYECSKGRFDEVVENDRLVPYLRHSKWGRWTQNGDKPSPTP